MNVDDKKPLDKCIDENHMNYYQIDIISVY